MPELLQFEYENLIYATLAQAVADLRVPRSHKRKKTGKRKDEKTELRSLNYKIRKLKERADRADDIEDFFLEGDWCAYLCKSLDLDYERYRAEMVGALEDFRKAVKVDLASAIQKAAELKKEISEIAVKEG
jgi:hypothetical protein